jgi:hypothetical protein
MIFLAHLVQILMSGVSFAALSRNFGCAEVALSVMAFMIYSYVNALAVSSIRADLPSLPYVGGFNTKENEEELERRAALKRSVADRLQRFSVTSGAIFALYFLAVFVTLVAQSVK